MSVGNGIEIYGNTSYVFGQYHTVNANAAISIGTTLQENGFTNNVYGSTMIQTNDSDTHTVFVSPGDAFIETGTQYVAGQYGRVAIGKGEVNPTSRFTVRGSYAEEFRFIDDTATGPDFNITIDDGNVYLDDSNITAILQDASTCPGRVHFVKVIQGATNATLIDAGGRDVEYNPSYNFGPTINGVLGVKVQSDGFQWHIIATV
jgi:hypothetical protein